MTQSTLSLLEKEKSELSRLMVETQGVDLENEAFKELPEDEVNQLSDKEKAIYNIKSKYADLQKQIDKLKSIHVNPSKEKSILQEESLKLVENDKKLKKELEDFISSNVLDSSYKHNPEFQKVLVDLTKNDARLRDQIKAISSLNAKNIDINLINEILAPHIPAGVSIFDIYSKSSQFYQKVLEASKQTTVPYRNTSVQVNGKPIENIKAPTKEEMVKSKGGIYKVSADSIVWDNTNSLYDGDTINIKTSDDKKHTLRLIGLDAYEASQGQLATDAKNRLVELIKDGFVIKTIGSDTYGRSLSILYDKNGNNITAQLIKEGLVLRTKGFDESSVPKSILDELNAAAQHAINNKVGIWGDKYPVSIRPDPVEYRRISDDLAKEKKKGKAVGTAINADAIKDKTADSQESDYKPTALNNGKEFQNLLAEPSIGHLSRLYDHYYTSADCKVYIKAPGDSTKYVMSDLITGIGYTYTVSSVPIYTIGSRFPAFFTTGNSIGNGSIIFPFKSAEYLRRMLKYVFNEYSPNVHTIGDDGKPKDPSQMSDEQFINASQSADNEDSLNPFPVTDIGSIVSVFDIHIRLNNKNAYYEGKDHSNQTTTHVIILKNCKLISENLEITSTRDGTIQHGFQFVFQNVLLGES